FTEAILAGRPIDVYNYGNMRRDFTYIDDIVDGILRLVPHLPESNAHWAGESEPTPARYQIHNIGSSQPATLLSFIETLENCLGKVARKNMLPLQPGDVLETYADIEALRQAVGFEPKTSIQQGLQQFVDWYQRYYGLRHAGSPLLTAS
ncbi:MAG: NAD-dependent epimerase/dehydratase family protein, partial [Cyanobacteria bacterium P01_A01_bin.135]